MTEPAHASWCDARAYAAGHSPCCNCGAATRSTGHWGPHRDKITEVGPSWDEFLKRLNLSYWPETARSPQRSMLRGQDGWAWNVTMRFQSIAHDLAQENPPFYWSSYYLLAQIIEKTRRDLTMLEAVEAIAIAFMAGGLNYKDAIRQLKQMGVWP